MTRITTAESQTNKKKLVHIAQNEMGYAPIQSIIMHVLVRRKKIGSN